MSRDQIGPISLLGPFGGRWPYGGRARREFRSPYGLPPIPAKIRLTSVTWLAGNPDPGESPPESNRSSTGKNNRRSPARMVDVDHSRTSVANILKDHGIDPGPRRRRGMSWTTFLKAHWDTIAAADFFTVEVWGFRGLVTFYVLFVIELSSRRVYFAGATPNPR